MHAEYEVQHKVRATVTDNGSNVVKAFREFETTEEAAPDQFDDGIMFLDMDGILQTEGDEELHFFLPSHQRCAAYTLNLTATNEVDKAASKVYRSAVQSVLLHGTRNTGHQQLERKLEILPA
ncbi:hypothetical protein LDENG_00193490 [Lucifuga dentata]|nr:hypothetical protein LDENG_00193490 [Lucifuga dentata]